jgi:hypothetical protein
MDKLKQRFKEDPAFALTVIVVAVPVGTALINSVAKMVEASAYAYRASKLN